jgi:3',5'-cyclic AMP phosphodiesterase CpdA
MEFTQLIKENVAPYSATKIAVYHKSGKRQGYIPLGGLAYPSDLGEKLYSFGALSDIHLGQNNTHPSFKDAADDFQRALEYFTQTEKVAFTCICGDLTNWGIVAEFKFYKKYVDLYSPNTPVYAISGNHDANDDPNHYQAETGALTKDFNGLVPYTGKPIYYTFEQGNDLFVMLGMYRWDYGYNNEDVFSEESINWLEETLAANTDKRIFLFQHALRFDGCGKPYPGSPTGNMLSVPLGVRFQTIVSQYPNVIWFHGHSHMTFDSQEDNPIANYDHNFTCHSVHIPSLATPREYENSAYVGKAAESEGYVVDVYKDYIVLRGRNFAEGKFYPLANYIIKTKFEK